MCLCRNSSLINCTLDSDISGLTCIDKEYCPYSEEPKSINLTLFVRNLYRLEEHQRTFFIRDIGKSFCAPVWSLHVMDYVYCGPIIYMNTSIWYLTKILTQLLWAVCVVQYSSAYSSLKRVITEIISVNWI